MNPPCLGNCSVLIEGGIWSIPFQFLGCVENSSVDSEKRKDCQLGVILEAKQQLWAKVNMFEGLNEIMSGKVLINSRTLTIVNDDTAGEI